MILNVLYIKIYKYCFGGLIMGNSGMIIIIALIGVALIVMIPITIKKKRAERNKALISARHNKDEV